MHHKSLGIFGRQEETPLHSQFTLSAFGLSTQSTVMPIGVAPLGSIVVSLPTGELGTTLGKVVSHCMWFPIETFTLDQALSLRLPRQWSLASNYIFH